MSYTFIKEIDEKLDETITTAKNVAVLCEGDLDKAYTLCEAASGILAKAREMLQKGVKFDPETIAVIAGVEFLADENNRQTIADSLKGGMPSILDALKKAGPDVKTNRALAALAKQHANTLLQKTTKEFEAAATDENVKKQLIMKLGKAMDVIGRVQSAAAKPAVQQQTGDAVASWFK